MKFPRAAWVWRGIRLGLTALVFAGWVVVEAAAEVEVGRVPDGAWQPQVARSADGTLHLVYLRGDAKSADVWYVRRPSGRTNWSEATRVNTVAGSAIAMGTIRGAQLALGDHGQPLVTWNGSKEVGQHPGVPLWFSQVGEGGKFAPELDVIRDAGALDGGGSVASGKAGQVFAVWHGLPPGLDGETNRAVYLATSTNGGGEFGAISRLDPPGLGVCACCGLKAAGRADGRLAVLYRAADAGVQRDATLLIRSADGSAVKRFVLDRWNVGNCPMSSFALLWRGDELVAAWETSEDVRWALVDPEKGTIRRMTRPPGEGRRKHPALAVNRRGETILAWVEDTGWNRGGSVAWQVFDGKGQPTKEQGRRDGVPAWGTAGAFVNAKSDFEVIY